MPARQYYSHLGTKHSPHCPKIQSPNKMQGPVGGLGRSLNRPKSPTRSEGQPLRFEEAFRSNTGAMTSNLSNRRRGQIYLGIDYDIRAVFCQVIGVRIWYLQYLNPRAPDVPQMGWRRIASRGSSRRIRKILEQL